MSAIIRSLRGDLRALRTLQAPEQVQWDARAQNWRVSSAAFKPQSDGSISVDLEEIQLREGLPINSDYPRVARAVGLVAHRIERLRADGFDVVHVPLPDNVCHGEARGTPTQGIRKRLASECEIIIAIDGDDAQRLKLENEARKARAALEG